MITTATHMETEHVERYIAYLRRQRASERTIEKYVRAVRDFVDFLRDTHGEDKFSLATVDRRMVEAFLEHSSSRRAIPARSTWNTRLAALRSFYTWAWHEEEVEEDPTKKIARIKTGPPPERIPLNFDEYLSLVQAAAASSDHYRTRNIAIVETLFHTGIRVSELASLDVDSVDFDNYAFLGVRAKGDRRLAVAINDLVATSIGDYLVDRSLEAIDCETALFLSDRKQRLSVRSVQRLIEVCGERAGISRKVTPHLLRHSTLTNLADLDVPLHVIAQQAGHRNMTTTARYVHAGREPRREAVDALSRRAKEARQFRRSNTDSLEGEVP